MAFRDHSSNVIAALSQRVKSIHSVELVEALAARWAMVLARELSLFDVILEGDCLQVVQALRCSGRCNTFFGHIVEESMRLGCSLQQCQFQHVHQEGNRFANGLARRVVSTADTIIIWVEEPPCN